MDFLDIICVDHLTHYATEEVLVHYICQHDDEPRTSRITETLFRQLRDLPEPGIPASMYQMLQMITEQMQRFEPQEQQASTHDWKAEGF